MTHIFNKKVSIIPLLDITAYNLILGLSQGIEAETPTARRYTYLFSQVTKFLTVYGELINISEIGKLFKYT